jgi:predicted GNAT superfamily acetyltransferase
MALPSLTLNKQLALVIDSLDLNILLHLAGLATFVARRSSRSGQELCEANRAPV